MYSSGVVQEQIQYLIVAPNVAILQFIGYDIMAKDEPIYNLVENDEIEDIGEDIDEISEDLDEIQEDTDEILRRIDRNMQSQNTTNKRVNLLIILWVLDKILTLGIVILGIRLGGLL